MPEIILTLLGMFVVGMFAYTLYKTNTFGLYITVNKWRGKKVILCEGLTSAIEGEIWKSVVEVLPVTGKEVAYRYSNYDLGRLTLARDGTGFWCGKFRWREVK